MIPRLSRAYALRLFVAACVLAPLMPVRTALAAYPDHPVTLVVAFTPGGPSDVLARIVGKKMEEILGAPFVIENKPGGGRQYRRRIRRACAARRLHAADGQ